MRAERFVTSWLRKAAMSLPIWCMILVVGHAQIGPPPVITVQPLDLTVPIGDDATFAVAAVSATKLSYQWLLNGTAAPGSNGKSAYSIRNVKVNSAGVYSVVVNNASGSVTSSFAVLNVIDVNAAPVLPNIDPQTVDEMTLLTVTNTATESNSRSTVGYTLANAPDGASVDADGVITWTPTGAQAPGTYTITTVAISTNLLDPINPQLSATNTFTVIVREVPPVLNLPALTGTNLTLTWVSVPEKQYRIEYAPDLSGTAWTPLADITATGTTASATDVITTTNRFYRLVVVH
ncbi:MAG: hypothetical protein DME19_15985 [Verrucomicrobia bacterium]|nr:MAG: hypothetical protein DME19_15985 [Verrucomicrobiota bacterium]